MKCLLLIICILLASFSPSPAGARRSAAGGKQKNSFSCDDKLTVDPSGSGNFPTIQAAIDSVHPNNPSWTCIYVKAGVYKEQVHIPRGKQFLYLEGQGEKATSVVWGEYGNIATSATLIVQADNVIVKGIAFTNSHNVPYSSDVKIDVAPAALLQGDKLAFYWCGFYGVQDTLWDSQGKHYFRDCTIQGAVDFIFGAGQSIYDTCTLTVTANVLKGPGFITAQGRSTPDEPNGFVFKDCTINGKGKTYLGRPWRPYARVLFFSTTMPDIIVPQGWDEWHGQKMDTVSFAERNCKGSGAVTAKRANFVNKMSSEELEQLTSLSYIDGSSWLIQV